MITTSGQLLHDLYKYVGKIENLLGDTAKEKYMKPVDGSNGEWIVHIETYEGEYDILMKSLNGNQDEEATIIIDGIPCMKFECRDGGVNGMLEIRNSSGDVELQGLLRNGKAEGLIREYCDSVMTWIGYYQEGWRYSYLQKSGLFEGFYEEWRVKDRELLSIAEYDKLLQDKQGRCIECVKGKMRMWIVENGEKKPVTQKHPTVLGMPCVSIDRRKGSSDYVSKRMRMSSLVPDSETDSLIEYDIEKTFGYGVWRTSEKCCEMKQSVFENRIVVADLNRHEMILYDNGVFRESVGGDIDCIDLDTSGRRWEGGVRDGKPCGYGVMYNEEGRKEYEGFFMNGRRCCYGTEYYNDVERVKYEGCYYDNNRFGKGVLYGRNGTIEYDGLWKNGEPRSSVCHDRTIDNHTESFDLADYCLDQLCYFSFPSWLHQLKRIVIKDGCYVGIRLFEINGLRDLESIVVGKNSFTYYTNEEELNRNSRYDGWCRFLNCPKLVSIQIGSFSFADYVSFEMTNLPSLQTIELDYYCFLKAALFSLTNLSQLQSIKLSDAALYYCQSIALENLPELRSVELGYLSLAGDDNDHQKTMKWQPYNFKNTLTMRNLPSLTSLKGSNNFQNIGSVILENIPQLSSSGIHLKYECFKYVYSLQSSNASELDMAIRHCSKYIPIDFTPVLFPDSVEWVVQNGSYNIVYSTPITISKYPCLKRIVIGEECFENVRPFVISGLHELESIVVERRCFSPNSDWLNRNQERSGGTCRIASCPKLISITIGVFAFSEYDSFELNDLSSLQSIHIGEYCFRYSPFSLIDLPQLNSVKLDYGAFAYCTSVVFENLTSLQHIDLQHFALSGPHINLNTKDDSPITNCTLTMKDLPSLSLLTGDGAHFQFARSVILENIPQLAVSNIRLGENCFGIVESIQSSSTHFHPSLTLDANGLESVIRSIQNKKEE